MLLPAGVVSPSVPDLQPLLQSLVDPGNTHDKSSCNGCIKHPIDDRLVDRIPRHGEGWRREDDRPVDALVQTIGSVARGERRACQSGGMDEVRLDLDHVSRLDGGGREQL